jgi:hypothetical protein
MYRVTACPTSAFGADHFSYIGHWRLRSQHPIAARDLRTEESDVPEIVLKRTYRYVSSLNEKRDIHSLGR